MKKVEKFIENLKETLKEFENDVFPRAKGRIIRITGLTMESVGPSDVFLSEVCRIRVRDGERLAEIVGFNDSNVLLMPLEDMTGISPGCEVIGTKKKLNVPVGMNLLSRVIDGLGRPIDGKGDVKPEGYYPLENESPNPLLRKRITQPIQTGIKAIDGFITLGKGQRIGIFSGSGVGKSTLLGMIARNTSADVNVIALIGERGREVREFIERDLGDGLKKSVVVVSTSDQPALIRVKALYTATAIAEYFRDEGMDVMLMVDSLTRWAMAQREVGLSIGEPPTTRGYTPSVFAGLPKLLERAGNSDKGSITAIYTVLVEADDFNEPISDTVRSIVDGHVILSRRLAESNHYPPIDILMSVSRLMIEVVDEDHLKSANRIREVLSIYNDMRDLIEVGAYKKGTDPKIDTAIDMHDEIMDFLKQGIFEKSSFEETVERMKEISERCTY